MNSLNLCTGYDLGVDAFDDHDPIDCGVCPQFDTTEPLNGLLQSVTSTEASHVEEQKQPTIIKRPRPRKSGSQNSANASSDAAGLIKRFRCPYPNCGKEFTTSGHLCRHRRTHTGEKNFACAYCGARFSRQDNCNQHARSHASNGQSTKPSIKLISESKSTDTSGSTNVQSSKGAIPHAVKTHTTYRTTSYTGSLVMSDTGYASSPNDCLHDLELSPEIVGQDYRTCQPFHFHDLSPSFSYAEMDLSQVALDPIGASSSESFIETDAAYETYLDRNFISEEDLLSWSASVQIAGLLPDDFPPDPAHAS